MKKWFFAMIGLILVSCIERVEEKESLPVLGLEEVLVMGNDGEEVLDTVITTVDSFNLVDQDSNRVTAELFDGKIYVVDFFFTHCPTICPIMTKNMLTIYEEFEEDPNVLFLSHTIDIRNDSVPQLKAYAGKIGIDARKWHMVTGDKNHIYDLAKQYMVSASEDNGAPGGYIHSGAFILMDGSHHIRGYYDGTLPEDGEQLIADIAVLKKEMNLED